MPCIVPTCGTTEGSFKLFPRNGILSGRWHEAIQVGSGCELENIDEQELYQYEICEQHFATGPDQPQPDEFYYQEPTLFTHCTVGYIEVGSCRMCLKFYPAVEMVSVTDTLGGKSIAAEMAEALDINLRDEDFLPLICIQCLARFEILLTIRTSFVKAEKQFKDLIDIAQTTALEIHNNFTLEHPSVDAFIEEEYDLPNDDVENVSKQRESQALSVSQLINPQNKDSKGNIARKKQKSNRLKAMHGKKCYICATIFPNATELLSHLAVEHATKDGYNCNECLQDFSHVIVFNRHLSRHEVLDDEYKTQGIGNNCNIDKSTFPCNSCNKIFKCQSKLMHHIKMKHENRKAPTCNICGKTFTAMSSLERHMLVHTKEKPHNCDKCDATFRRALELRNHISIVHDGINPHICQECRASFKNYHALYIHRQTVHRNKPVPVVQFKPYHLTCKLCKRQHNKSNELIDHIREEHADQDYPYVQCPDCPRTFLSQQHLSHHKEVHTDKYACSYCGLRNPTIQRLQNHVENKHSEVRKYDCRLCINKSYKTKAALRKHVLMHTHGKQFQCDICQKTFMRKDQMVIHRRIHTGEKPFRCETCLKRFSDDAMFSKHKKRCWPLPVNIDDDLNSLFQEY
ncbi:zinc finger protein 345-like [Sabethes cyaneus]|uniref:zinc finger protein 345-like n=1 Tax=Sabethes cyaneus TaxID=53552 RepID=UPI00237EAB57|nr:zinc finger protein 345-like [Sabethes cyaneus]